MTQGGERVVARRKLCTELAARLSQHLKDSSNHFYRGPAIKLRGDLKTACVQFLLEDYPDAQAAGVEQQLWTKVFYDVIKNFRGILAQGQAAQTSNPQNLKQVTATFLKFLKEAKEFYQKLARQLQEAYGNSGISGSVSPELSPAPGAGPPREPRDIRVSIYRCLICLGDLARYEIQAVPASVYEWSPAERLYRQAIAVYPEGGNSYNNLAVISNIQGADIAAVYYYVRSLAVKDPFHIAERNLEQIFEKFRIKYEGLSTEGTGKIKPRRSKAALAVLVPELSIRFARLYGLLFSTINLDLFPEVMEGAVPCLDDLLERTSVLVGPQGHGPKRSDVLVLQLVVVAIYFVDKSAGKGKLPGSGDTMQKEILRHSRTLLFTLAARLLGAVTSLGDAGRIAASPIMPTICVSLQYLASAHEHVRITNADTLEMVARRDLWTSLAAFINAAPPSAESGGVVRFALSEDRTLLSFLPLAAGHRGLEFGLEPADPPAARMHRIYVSIKNISKVLEDPPSQSVFEVKGASQMLAAVDKVQKALELSEARASKPALLPQVPASVPAVSAAKAAAPTHQTAVRAPWAGAPPVDDDEEDEEVIVYNPTRANLMGTTPSPTMQGQSRAEPHSTLPVRPPVPPPAAVNTAQADRTTSAPANDGRVMAGDTTMVSAPTNFGFADDLVRDDDVPESIAAAPVSEADVEMLDVPDSYGVSAWREPPPTPMPSAALTAAVQSAAPAAQVDALPMSVHDPAPQGTPEPALGLGPVVSAPPRRTIEAEVPWERQTAAPGAGFLGRRSVNPSQDSVWPGSHTSSPTRGPLQSEGAAPFSGYDLPPSNPLQALPDLLDSSRFKQQLVSAQGNQVSMAAMWTPDTSIQGDMAGLSRQTSPDAPLAYSGYMLPMSTSSMGLASIAQLQAIEETASFMRPVYGGGPGISLGDTRFQPTTPTLGDLLKQTPMLYTTGSAVDLPHSRRVTSMPAFDQNGFSVDPFCQASYPAGAGLPAHGNPDDPDTNYRGDDHFGAPRATSLPHPSPQLFGGVGGQAPFPGVSLGRLGGQYLGGTGRTSQYPGFPVQGSTDAYHPLGVYASTLTALHREGQQGLIDQARNQQALSQLSARPVTLPGLFSSESVFTSAPPVQRFGGLSGLSGIGGMASASWLEDYTAPLPSGPSTALNPGLNTNPFPGSLLGQRFQPFATDTHYGV